MSLAVMQPYLFPYIGYFQLINAVDTFIFYDDVDFIKQGWINRNRLLVNQRENFFTIPLSKSSSNKKIFEIKTFQYEKFKNKFLITIYQNYKKAPQFEPVFNLVESILIKETEFISELAINSVVEVSEYLDLKIIFKKSSISYQYNKDIKGVQRIIDICNNENDNYYINLIGGLSLYSKDIFKQKNIIIDFIKSKPITYNQFNNEFVPWLSIIDVLMFNDKTRVKEYLTHYDLI